MAISECLTYSSLQADSKVKIADWHKGRYTLPLRTGRKERPHVRPVEDTRTIP